MQFIISHWRKNDKWAKLANLQVSLLKPFDDLLNSSPRQITTLPAVHGEGNKKSLRTAAPISKSIN